MNWPAPPAKTRFGDAQIEEDKILDKGAGGRKPPSQAELERSFEDAKKFSQEKLGDQARTYGLPRRRAATTEA